MFNIGPAEVMVILVVALLVLGPNKLPDAARQVGRAMGELRRLSSGFQAEMRDALKEPVEGKPTPAGTAKASAENGALSSPRPPAGDMATTESATIDSATTEAAPASDRAAATGGAATVTDVEAADQPIDRDEAVTEAVNEAVSEPGASNGTSPG